METQERLLSGMSQLVGAVNRLVEANGACGNGLSNDIDLSPEAITDAAPDDMAPETAMLTSARALQEVQLGFEIDQCSGLLTVRNRFGQWVTVPRGQWTVIDVAIDGNGYWFWRCGSSNERSRGAPNFRPRVKRLKILHSTESRKITWWCYDLL
jgi:hypothetical protein